MKSTNQNPQIKIAYVAARDAIVKQLGKSCTQDEVIDVLQLLVHQVLTDCGNLPVTLSQNNVNVFSEQLRALVETTQSGIKSTTACGTLM